MYQGQIIGCADEGGASFAIDVLRASAHPMALGAKLSKLVLSCVQSEGDHVLGVSRCSKRICGCPSQCYRVLLVVVVLHDVATIEDNRIEALQSVLPILNRVAPCPADIVESEKAKDQAEQSVDHCPVRLCRRLDACGERFNLTEHHLPMVDGCIEPFDFLPDLRQRLVNPTGSARSVRVLVSNVICAFTV